MSCVTITANCQNTTTINDEYLQNAIKWIEQGKIDAQLVVLLTQKVDSLNKRIGILQSISADHKEKDAIQEKIASTYEEELKNTREQLSIAMAGMKKLDKKLRRQRLKNIIIGVGSAGATAAIFILLNK
jgi:hypothetical protein